MKKSLLIIALAVSIISCNKEQTATSSSELKTAYVDTAKLMEEYTEAKDLEAKFKAKSEAEAKKFEVEEANFKAEVANFQKMHKQTVKLGLNKKMLNWSKDNNVCNMLHKV